MPKGFLVKRQKNRACYSWRRRDSAEDAESRSDSGSGSEVEVPVLHVGSPDSGYSQSPVNLTFKPSEVTTTTIPTTGGGAASQGSNENRPPSTETLPPPPAKVTVCKEQPPPQNFRPFQGGLLPSSRLQDQGGLLPSSRLQDQGGLLPSSRLQDQGGLLPSSRLQDAKEFAQRARMLGSSSPLNISAYPPFYFPTFDRLSVTSPNAKTKLSVNGNFIHATTNFSNLLPVSSRVPGRTQPIPGVQQTTTHHPPPKKGTAAVMSPPPPAKTQTISPKKRGNDGEANLASKPKSSKKNKTIRRIQFEEADKKSPVSGTIIKEFSDSEDEGIKVTTGDIDSSLNFVEVTPEARAELEKIENKIGDYDCQLCKEHYEDAFQLAQHRCSRIVHVEYRCPECDKVFNCPANLASHRRWHKPRPNKNNNNTIKASTGKTSAQSGQPQPQKAVSGMVSPKGGLSTLDVLNGNVREGMAGREEGGEGARTTPSPASSSASDEGQYECSTCGKKFRRPAYLRKHLLTHTEDPYHCHLCGKGFRSETARAKHVLQHSLDSIAVNMSTAAAARETVICPTCSQPFPNKAALERHSKIHSGEVYNCKFCTAVFYSSPGLTRHINKCHPTENRQVILLQMPHVNRTC